MGSNILNMYYVNIGHKSLRSASESGTSDSSCNQNSPEYTQSQKTNEEDSDDTEYWNDPNQEQVWSQNEQVSVLKVNISKSNHNMNGDENAHMLIQNVHIDDRISNSDNKDCLIDVSVDENSLVEGDDYDIIQVIPVHPDLNLIEVSSDEEADDCESQHSDEAEYCNSEDDFRIQETCENPKVENASHAMCSKLLGINVDTPVVSNVDEYFIKHNDEKNMFIPKDEPVVKDVDDYFIKETVDSSNDIENIENGSQYDQGIDFRITDSKNDYVIDSAIANVASKKKGEPKHVANVDCINDLEGLSNIDYLKQFILEDLHCQKIKSTAKTQNSVSLPQTPMHNICMEIDAKTCFSFEDLDLSDLSFEKNTKIEYIPRTLTDEDVNSFLITNKSEIKTSDVNENVDDLTHQDMEIEIPLDAMIKCAEPPETINVMPSRSCTSTPLPAPVLEFCLDKMTPIKNLEIKSELGDFVDIESCADGSIPVLKANNLNSLLEQFEATEKLNSKTIIESNEQQVKLILPSSRMRQQDAGIQLNKNKMRHILMPTTVNATVTRTTSPVHADHDYCSSKKLNSITTVRRGQSLLKPDVLSNNSMILSSRHRSCKDKKIVYNLSSDDESDSIAKRKIKNDSGIKSKKTNLRKSKSIPKSKTVSKRAQCSPRESSVGKNNGSVIANSASKASDKCSQNSSGSIKLTIKNKSEVIINNIDSKAFKNDKNVEKQKVSIVKVDKKLKSPLGREIKIEKNITDTKEVKKEVPSKMVENKNEVKNVDSKPEHLYTGLFTNEKDVRIPHTVGIERNNKTKAEDPLDEQPKKKKKLNLQEYKLRRGVSSNNSSAQVSPEAIFPETSNIQLAKSILQPQKSISSRLLKKEIPDDTPKTIFDPIREASRKIIMISKKQKVEAMRKKEEEMLMRKIGKVETLELQPLISDSEMMKIIGMTPEVIPVPLVSEKMQTPRDYDEVVLVSIGTNTDENVFKLTAATECVKRKSESPQNDKKPNINFKIRKQEHLLKHNVFDSMKKDNMVNSYERHHADKRIDKDRFKDITATLKSVEKQVETKISSNSLFASIQDVVMKKAPSSTTKDKSGSRISPKLDNSHVKKQDRPLTTRITIIRDYENSIEHGEDKVILHLKKDTVKPTTKAECSQTEPSEHKTITVPTKANVAQPRRNRHDSDMSLSSEDIPVVTKNQTQPPKQDTKVAVVHPRIEPARETQKEKPWASERYDCKYRRSRSHSRGRRRASPARNRSRDRYHAYRRRESPYRRARRSRSPYRASRRSPSWRDYRPNRTRSRSRHDDRRKSKTPVAKRPSSPKYNYGKSGDRSDKSDRKPAILPPPPVRKPTISESSYTSSVSRSSSSSTSSSSLSSKCSSYRKEEGYRNKTYSYSSEDRENNTPVEERRIVFVGKLEKELTKAALRAQFARFGPVSEVRLHSKEDGSRYGFVTFQRPRDAWSAVESAGSFPQYDVGFGGRRAFCRQSYADLDGLEAKYTESAFHGQPALPARRNDGMSFEQMLLDMKNKLNKRKGDKRLDDPTA